MKQTMNPAVARVLKRLHYPLDVFLMCVRWYVAYPLSLRHLEEMMAERGISVDHSTVHRWALKLLPVLEKAFRRHKRPVGKSWRVDDERKWLLRSNQNGTGGGNSVFRLRFRDPLLVAGFCLDLTGSGERTVRAPR